MADICPGMLCWSTLHQGDERVYRVLRVFAHPHHPDAGPQAELETAYRADLTAMPAGKKQKPISRNCGFLVPLTPTELQRRIDVLSALSSMIGGVGDGVD